MFGFFNDVEDSFTDFSDIRWGFLQENSNLRLFLFLLFVKFSILFSVFIIDFVKEIVDLVRIKFIRKEHYVSD